MEVGHDAVKIRNTHPGLYRSIRVISIMTLALAANFWFGPPPAFNPFGIHRFVIGGVFAFLGLWQFVFLDLRHSLRMVRLGLAFSFVFTIGWGFANAQQSFAGKASFQLPILYIALGVIQRYLLTEAPINPMTRVDPE